MFSYDSWDCQPNNVSGIQKINVLRLMEDVGVGRIMKEFIGLSSKKIYSIYIENSKVVAKAKDISKHLARNLTLANYRDLFYKKYIILLYMLALSSKLR